MNEIRDDFHQVLKPIDVDAIYEEIEDKEEEPKGPAYGNSFKGGRRNQDELNRQAFLGMSQVYMNNHNKPLSEAQKKYRELCQIPVEELCGLKKQDESDEFALDEPMDLDMNDDILSYNLNDETDEELGNDYGYTDDFSQAPPSENIFTTRGNKNEPFETEEFKNDEQDLQHLEETDKTEGYAPTNENFFIGNGYEKAEYDAAA